MTMLSAKKKKTISDQINEVLKPKELVEEKDENEARFEEFTEHSEVVNQLSDIRKQTAKNLSEIDSKYKGKLVTRAELENDHISSGSEQSDDGEDLSEVVYTTDSDEDDELIDEAEEEEEEGIDSSEEISDLSGVEDDPGNDYDLSQFTQFTLATTSASSIQEPENELLKKSSLKEEIKKGVSVQNQLKVWEKLLEVRIKSQKMLITANSLPDFNAHLELSTMDDSTFPEKVDRTCDGLYGLLDNLLELQSTLVNR